MTRSAQESRAAPGVPSVITAVASSGGGGVWRVTSSGAATRVAQINDVSGKLEGVVTVPNDSSKYGPWAGKILTCGEVAQLTYAVDANGNVTPYDFTMPKPEDVRLVAAGQNLYCLDEPNNLVLKVPQSNFSSFAGDVLLVDEQEASLLLVHWTGGQFVTRKIFPGANALEHVAFAPIDIPPLP